MKLIKLNYDIFKNKLIIGLTGLYASGKSTIANIFAKNGYYIIEADCIGHIALEKKKNDIIKQFGISILNDYDNVDRKKLGNIVFHNMKSLKQLENIVHPFIVKEIKTIIEKNKHNKILINAAILHKMRLNLFCHKIIYVSATEKQIINWAIKRDKITKDNINQRLKSQYNIKLTKEYSDYCMINDGNINKLLKKTESLIIEIEKDILN